jgi:hypothetical protein
MIATVIISSINVKPRPCEARRGGGSGARFMSSARL